ncbi:uncharacterized protein FMAN_15416 [Fusarium mangiferae]|uniref:Uncharacterized protein n=1 Tax=Fusarium mangiferae TaxID=192010 RepID=A0A1L7UKU9_FUSMA|nr:uncharacterized protein FMAN_15416 [Fusarium mangiferae]CVL09073.1 uncharacterized protein FMAN_15416 [Fusarium mangiferae]
MGTIYDDLFTLPSELPRLGHYDAEYIYIINLDLEILTINNSIHWKLGNILRNNLWLRAIADSIYPYKPTISLDVFPEEYIASSALELPTPDRMIGYNFATVVLKRDMEQAPIAFLRHVLAETLIEHKDDIVRFGRGWSPALFPFLQVAFTLVSIASGQASFFYFPDQPFDPRSCYWVGCNSNHLHMSSGWLDQDWAGDHASLLEFGSMSRRPDELPGVSHSETIYWHEDVLVSLSLIVDGKAITEAVTYGVEQGRVNLQIVVFSLFKAAFAEAKF